LDKIFELPLLGEAVKSLFTAGCEGSLEDWAQEALANLGDNAAEGLILTEEHEVAKRFVLEDFTEKLIFLRDHQFKRVQDSLATGAPEQETLQLHLFPGLNSTANDGKVRLLGILDEKGLLQAGLS
jgi:hypothetical protein